MKKYMLFLLITLLTISCNGQKSKNEAIENNEERLENEPSKGSWKVDKEYDEYGNLIKYDSIYSWSSNNAFNDLSIQGKDSLINSFQSKFFRNFSQFENQGFENMFTPDSLFSKQFFNDNFFKSDFGKDFMDLDNLRQQMLERQKKFLKKYQSEFIKPEEKKSGEQI